jgi:hypothetical protein
MLLVPLTRDLALQLTPQPGQSDETPEERVGLMLEQAKLGPAWVALHDNAVVAAGGITTAWEGRGVAWALLAVEAGRCMLQLTRATRRCIDAAPHRRIEMYVDAQFTPGFRWAQMLGFRLETPEPMRAFTPNGNDAYLFARTR